MRIHTHIKFWRAAHYLVYWSNRNHRGGGPPAESNQTPRAIVPITKCEKCATAQVLNYLSLVSLSLLISNEIGSALPWLSIIKCIDTWAMLYMLRGETFICVRLKNLVCRAKKISAEIYECRGVSFASRGENSPAGRALPACECLSLACRWECRGMREKCFNSSRALKELCAVLALLVSGVMNVLI